MRHKSNSFCLSSKNILIIKIQYSNSFSDSFLSMAIAFQTTPIG